MTVYTAQTYTNPSTLNSDPGDPVTSELAKAALFNVRAVAQGAAGADAIADAVFSGQRTTTGTTTYNLAGEYGGAWLDFTAYAAPLPSATTAVTIDFSDDSGSTWSSALALTGTLTTNQYLCGRLFVDYTAGDYKLFITSSDAIGDLGLSTGTIGSWPSGNITTMRVSVTIVGGAAKASWIGRHQGGNSL